MEIRIRTSCGRDAFRDGSGANREVPKRAGLKIALALGDEAASPALDCFPIWRMLRAESTFMRGFERPSKFQTPRVKCEILLRRSNELEGVILQVTFADAW